MIVLALILMIAAGAFAAAVLIEANEAVSPQVWGISTDTSAAGVFAAGAVTMLVFLLGLWLLKRALARARRMRSEVKSLKRGRNEDVARLQDEKAQLEAELRRDNHHSGPTEVTRTDSERAASQAAGNEQVRHVDLTAVQERESRR